MAYTDLQDYIAALERHGLLRRISVEVDPFLEITELADRMVKRQGPALLFERVRGSSYPLLINAFGSWKHIHLALETDSLDAIGEQVNLLLDPEVPKSFMDKLKMLPKLRELASFLPKQVSSGPCKAVIERQHIDLTELPILHCWPQDGGRFITMGVVFTRNPVNERRNIGMYRLHLYDERTTGMHWHLHKHGAHHFHLAWERGEPLEVAVAIGCDPAVVYAATAPLPDDVDELLFAGFLRKKPVEVVHCETVNLEVPAHAEFILEGYVNPGELRREGPFGDHTGYYSLADDYPVFHVTCMTRRRNPIYLTTIVGKPPMEDLYLGKATERIFLPLLRKQLPEIVDMNLPAEGIFHNLVLVSIRKRYPGQAQKVMHALWGLGQMMFAKIIAVFDAEVNVQDLSEVLWRLGNAIEPERDITFVKGPLDALNHASSQPHYGSKMGIDCTRKLPEEGFTREWPDEIVMSEEVRRLVDRRWRDYGIEGA
ncbi:MAG: menaquinone biosynthesis decarboxylase [Candidatus Tectomicrobia bacterium]|nr:menaquinone biosynthesis decarboxylase [Candidatus Tectomicrobia bacterium]